VGGERGIKLVAGRKKYRREDREKTEKTEDERGTTKQWEKRNMKEGKEYSACHPF
jgi:hypothetical protein